MDCRDVIAKMEKINFTTGEIIWYLKRFRPVFRVEEGSEVQYFLRSTERGVKNIKDIIEGAEAVSCVNDTENDTGQENESSGHQTTGSFLTEGLLVPIKCEDTVKCVDNDVWEDTVKCEDTEMCEDIIKCEDIKQEVSRDLDETDITDDSDETTDNDKAIVSQMLQEPQPVFFGEGSEVGVASFPPMENQVQLVEENEDNLQETSPKTQLHCFIEDIDKLATKSNGRRTAKLTRWGVSVLREWLDEKEEAQDFESLSESSLGALLAKFYAELLTKSGQQYSRSSLIGIRSAIQRHLNHPPFCRNIDIIRSPQFRHSNNVLKGAIKELKKSGLDKSASHCAISEPDIEKPEMLHEPEPFYLGEGSGAGVASFPPMANQVKMNGEIEHNSTNNLQLIKGKVGRFKELDTEDINKLAVRPNGYTTNKLTKWGISILKEWLLEQGEPLDFENLSESSLGALLARFFTEVRTKDGTGYSRQSLMAIRSAIQRQLNLPHLIRRIDIIHSPAFKDANNVIMQMIPSTTSPISGEDMKKIYSSGALATSDPISLQFKVFFELSLHLKFKGRNDLRFLKTEHIILKEDSEGHEYAMFTINPAANNYEETIKTPPRDHRMYATGGELCPIASLKTYISRLNPKCDSFFQRPSANYTGDMIWYVAVPVGTNTLGKFMERISNLSQLSMTYVNRCIRATPVSTFYESGLWEA